MTSECGGRRRHTPADGFSPASVTPPVTCPGSRRKYPRSGVQTLLLFVGILLVIALVVGGVLIGLQVNKSGSNPAVGSSTSPTSPPATKAPTGIPTNATTATPTSTSTTTQSNSIQKWNTVYY